MLLALIVVSNFNPRQFRTAELIRSVGKTMAQQPPTPPRGPANSPAMLRPEPLGRVLFGWISFFLTALAIGYYGLRAACAEFPAMCSHLLLRPPLWAAGALASSLTRADSLFHFVHLSLEVSCVSEYVGGWTVAC